ncbi:hypothetical protein [Dietzia sp.]|uniref:hypothetical protein n=1 Tax=Dietzia sp. TaxID=1871616 RepID=UPI002FDAD903
MRITRAAAVAAIALLGLTACGTSSEPSDSAAESTAATSSSASSAAATPGAGASGASSAQGTAAAPSSGAGTGAGASPAPQGDGAPIDPSFCAEKNATFTDPALYEGLTGAASEYEGTEQLRSAVGKLISGSEGKLPAELDGDANTLRTFADGGDFDAVALSASLASVIGYIQTNCA